MFCSNCGKTLKSDAETCPYCGQIVGESRFDGNPYTAAQIRVKPGEAVRMVNYSRTTYTGMDQSDAGDVYSRTTYRAVGEDVPEETAAAPVETERTEEGNLPIDDVDLAEPKQEEPLTDVPDSIKKEYTLDDFRAKPIDIEKPRGISSDVQEYIEQLKNKDIRRQGGRAVDRGAETPELNLDTAAKNAEEESGAFELDDDASAKPRAKMFGRFDVRQVVRIVAVVLVVAAVLTGIVVGLSYVFRKTASAPIGGVTLVTYTDGVQLIESHATETYKAEKLSLYQTGLDAFNTALASDLNAVTSLLPATPDTNDQRFIDTLAAIQTNINNALTMDALSSSLLATMSEEDILAASGARWQVVNDAIAGLKLATTATQLDAIIAGEKVEIVEQTTEAPTATPKVYTSLSKGMQTAAVTEMQQRLTELGFFTDAVDGDYGSKTQTAVKLFQQYAGLEVTGIADEATQIAIFDDNAPRYGKAATVTETPDPNAAVTPEPAADEAAGEATQEPILDAPVEGA